MTNEWQPDYVVAYDDPLSKFITVYLDGEQQKYCFQARIKWASFDEPTFGELIVASLDNDSGALRHTITCLPYLGDLNLENLWVKPICGKVLMHLAAEGEPILAALKKAAEGQ